MRKRKRVLHMNRILILLLMCFSAVLVQGQTQAAAEDRVQSYEEYGRVAMKKTMEKYPGAQITDYLHVGKKTKGNTSTETFKLVLKERGKTFEIFVYVEYSEKTKKVTNVTFKDA